MVELDKILCVDIIKGLSDLPSETVDIIVTSPPYNLGKDHHTGDKRHNPYNDNLPENTYQEQQINVLKELYRVLKPDGSLFYNHKNRIKNGQQITPYEWLLKTPFVIKQEIIWVNRSQNFDKIRFYPWTERVYWLTKSPKTKLYNAINHYDFLDYNEWKPVGTKGKHTRAFPEKMVEDILMCFPESRIVLDPYMGSGTTAVVAKRLGKKYIGFEINQEFIELADERLQIL